MEVILAKHAGYCYGVERALELAKEASVSCPKPIVTLGPIIHNPQVVDWLKSLGIHPATEITQRKGTVIIRSHGIDPAIARKFKDQGLKVVDATCPFVKKAQSCARQLKKEGYELVIVGERNHPEVIGILAYAEQDALVVEKAADLAKLSSKYKKLGVVVQTTQSEANFAKVVADLSSKSSELKVFNTICDATIKRQAAAKELALTTDVVFVVGGKNSANTTRLAKICKEINPSTYHIETAAEINSSTLAKAKRVGITAGASTADWILEEVADLIRKVKV